MKRRDAETQRLTAKQRRRLSTFIKACGRDVALGLLSDSTARRLIGNLKSELLRVKTP
jgi:hypothetical protein